MLATCSIKERRAHEQEHAPKLVFSWRWTEMSIPPFVFPFFSHDRVYDLGDMQKGQTNVYMYTCICLFD